jgi:CheY-like chemotaxis protein
METTNDMSPAPKKRRALLVEDDRDMRKLLGWMLRGEGLEVIEADGGVDLLDWMNRTAVAPWDRFFDLIVSDINLPDLSAIEVLAALRCRAWKAPVILVTAFSDTETRREARELGACAVLDKPLGRDDLRSALSTISAVGALPMEVACA